MTAANFLFARFGANASSTALIFKDEPISYGDLLSRTATMHERLEREGIAPGAVIALVADFSPTSTAFLLACLQRAALVALLSPREPAKREALVASAQAEWVVEIDSDEQIHVSPTGKPAEHELLRGLRAQGRPGYLIFTSGTLGRPKTALHDAVPFLEKFREQRSAYRAMLFMPLDHLGGINGLFNILSRVGVGVIPTDRTPEVVAATIARHRVQDLPASPTFLTLLLLSGAYERHDLSSLAVVNYGSEPMALGVLERLSAAFPKTQFRQTYGMTEVGIMHAKSRSSDSLWMKVDAGGFRTRVVDGLLEIKAPNAMLGYLDAPSPFTEDGWYKTGDVVEVDGEWLRVLGRKSEMINVGGEKVYPAEVESILQMMDGVVEVVVRGEPNAITGSMVTALVRIDTGESLREFRTRMRTFCQDKLLPFKIPAKVTLADGPLHGARFKKMR